MRLFCTALLVSGLLLTPAGATPDHVFLVAGERYAPAFDRTSQNGEHLVEFTRPGETVKTWTTLLALHAYPADHRTPKEAAVALARLAGQRDRSAVARVMENAANDEAIVVFVTASQDPADDTVEVAAFRYARAADRQSLVAAHLSSRFTLGEVDADDIRNARTWATEGLAALRMDEIRAFLAPTA